MKYGIQKIVMRFLALSLCGAMLVSYVPASLIVRAQENTSQTFQQLTQSELDKIKSLYSGGDMSNTLTYDCGNGLKKTGDKSYLTIVQNTDDIAFESFKANLALNGYQLQSENTIASKISTPNSFASYLSEDRTYKLYTYYLAEYQETRIIIDTQKETVEGYQYEAQVGVQVEPKLVMWGLPMSEIGYDISEVMSDDQRKQRNCGSMFVILMPDNSLFVQDGGDVQQWDDEICDMFLDFCRDLTGTEPGEKMVINTWMISHAHRDHFKGFYRFLNRHHDQFDLKNVMYNIDDERIGKDYDITGALAMVRKHFPDARYYKPHTGEVLDIAGVRIDVMYSIEDRYVPNANHQLITDDDNSGGTYRDYMYKDASKLTSNFNDTTVTLRVTFQSGVDAILYADMALSTKMMLEAYHDDFIQADIVTVPHHGFDLRTELMNATHPKVFLYPQRERAVYGPDGDVTTVDLYATFHKTLRNNFLQMFPGMVVPKGTKPDVTYKMFWAGNNAVTIDINTLANTADPTTSTAYYTTLTTPEVSYTGWGCEDLFSDPKDQSDRLISMSGEVSTTDVKAGGTFGVRMNPVKNATLKSNNFYAIMHQATENILAYESVAIDTDRAQKGTSIYRVADKSNASEDYNVFYIWNNNQAAYFDHSQMDKALWYLAQEGKSAGANLANLSTSVKPLFGGSAVYEKTSFYKGYQGQSNSQYKDQDGSALVGNWWTALQGEDDNSPRTQYRFLNPRNYDHGWVTFEPIADKYADRTTYRIEYLGTDSEGIGEFLIYWTNGTQCNFLTCNADGSWGIKVYSTVAAAKKELANLKLRLYSFQYLTGTNDPKQIRYSAAASVFNVERGTTVDQLLDIFHDQGKLHIENSGNRDYINIPCSGLTRKVGYYYFVFDRQYDPSSKGYSTYTISVMYAEITGSDTKLLDITVNLYERQMQFEGSGTIQVDQGATEADIRGLITQNITVSSLFHNANGSMGSYEIAYSQNPEGGKYHLEFDGDYANVLYRRTDGSDILVKTLIVSVQEEILSFEPPAQDAYIQLNSGPSAPLKDASGNDLTMTINGTSRKVTVGMLGLDGQLLDTSAEGNYNGVSLIYCGHALFQDLHVTITKENLLSEGDAGYVSIDKFTTTSQDTFNQTGIANIQLSAEAVEMGVDLIVVMDLSGSMHNSLDSSSTAENYRDSRIYAMESSLKEMIKYLQTSGADVRIAMSDFGDLDHFELAGATVDSTIAAKSVLDLDFNNGKYASSFEFANHLNYVFTTETGSSITHNPFGVHETKWNMAVHTYTGSIRPTVYTGSGKVNAAAFVDVNTLFDGQNFSTSMNRIISRMDDNVRLNIGTNYDIGLEYAYHLGYSIQQENIANGLDREIVCIFLSDGGPMQYNYFSGNSKSTAWIDWISGNIDSIGSAGYSAEQLPAELEEIQDQLLAKFKAGKLTRPEYRRGPWNHLLYQQNSDGTYSSTGTSINVASNGYFIYRDRYYNSSLNTFYEYMDAMGYDLDWDYLCRIAFENGLEDFGQDYYGSDPVLSYLLSLFRDREFIGYENAGGGVYHKVYRTKLINPSVTITQHYQKSDYSGDDFFEAMRSIGVECTWDLFAKIALKNIDSDITKGKELMTAFNSILRTVPEGYEYGTLSPYSHFYNEDGKNWWAEAIKGDTNQLYPVINKYAYGDSPYAYNGDVTEDYQGKTYMSGFRGLGMDIYAISFSVADDNLIKTGVAQQVMNRISSNDSGEGDYLFTAGTQAELTDALISIVRNMADGATDASVTDTLGENFELYYGQVSGVNVDAAIRILSNGKIVETITFGNDNEAYSSCTSGNIWLSNGQIQGQYVSYDTLTKTFHWNIGKMGTAEFTFEYQIYLIGSADGTLQTNGVEKSFPAGEQTIMSYLNHLCSPSLLESDSPVFTWQTAATVLPNIQLVSPTLLLEDTIKLNIYFTIDQDIPLADMGMLTWSSKPSVVDISTADKVYPGATFDGTKYSVNTDGIPAQNLGDVIYFCIYAKLADGSYVYGKQVQYSPTQYAYNQLKGNASPKIKALLVAILNYGAAAQTYLGDSDSLINADLTDAMKALVEEYRSDMVHSVAPASATKQGDLAYNGGYSSRMPNIALGGAFSINYYFVPSAEVAGDMTFYYWNAADFEAADVLTTENATGSAVMTLSNGQYCASISGIAAKDVDSALYACGVYTDVNGNTYSTGVLPYSLGFYCGNQAKGTGALADLAASIAVYGYYASIYFAQ